MTEETPTSAAPPVRVCSKCSVQSQMPGDFCPHCGKSYTRRSRKPNKKAIAIAIAAVMVTAGAAAGITLKLRHDHAEERAAAASDRRAVRDAAEQERLEAAEEVAELQESRQKAERKREAVERTLRQAAIKEMQQTISKDARESVTDGLLEGPILYTFCNPLGGGSADDLTAITTTFDCLAVNEELDDGRASGYGFDATMNWDDGSYTWQLQS